MNNKSVFLLIILIAVLLTTQGFQCGSPEFSGAKLRITQKDFKGAIALLETEVQKNPGNEEAWYLLGGLKADQNDYAGMNVAFATALKISDKHAKEIRNYRYSKWGYHINLGVGYLERASSDSAQFFDLSITEFNRAIEIWADTSLTYRYLGIAYNNKGDLDNAQAAFQTAWDKGKDLDALKRVGRIYFVKGNDLELKFEDNNRDKIQIAKNLNEINKGSHKNDVMRAFGAPDNVRKAPPPPKGSKKPADKKEEWTYNNFNMVLEIDGEKVVNKKFTGTYKSGIDSALFKQALVHYDNAARTLEIAKETDPKDNENLNFLLQAYVKSGKIKEAVKTFRLAVKNDPGNKTNHYILGILLRTDGDFQGGIEEFKTAYGIDSTYTDALFDLGATLYNWGVDILKAADAKGEENTEYKKKFEEALPYLEKVTEVKKDDPMVWETLGTIYARLGKSDLAMKAFDKADKLRKGN